MTDPHSIGDGKTAREQAIDWFSRMRLGGLTAAEQADYEAWRAASPEHDRHCRILESIWTAADDLPRDRMRSVLRQAEPSRPAFYRRREFVWGLGATGAAVAAAGVVVPRWWYGAPDFATSLATVRGERRDVRLPDDSVLTLNTDTQAVVQFYPERRVAHLESGEIMFSVQPDQSRPFTVLAGKAEVFVTGTVFNVRLDAGRVAVAVESGTVRFSSGAWWNRQSTQMTAGCVSRLENGLLEAAHPGDVASVTAWRRGRLVFQDTPLATVVAELNRYLEYPLRIADPRLNPVRVAGTFGIDDPDAMLEALPLIAPVRVLRNRDGGAVITSR